VTVQFASLASRVFRCSRDTRGPLPSSTRRMPIFWNLLFRNQTTSSGEIEQSVRDRLRLLLSPRPRTLDKSLKMQESVFFLWVFWGGGGGCCGGGGGVFGDCRIARSTGQYPPPNLCLIKKIIARFPPPYPRHAPCLLERARHFFLEPPVSRAFTNPTSPNPKNRGVFFLIMNLSGWGRLGFVRQRTSYLALIMKGLGPTADTPAPKRPLPQCNTPR